MASITVTVRIEDGGTISELTETYPHSGNPLFHATEVIKLAEKISGRVGAVYGDIRNGDRG